MVVARELGGALCCRAREGTRERRSEGEEKKGKRKWARWVLGLFMENNLDYLKFSKA